MFNITNVSVVIWLVAAVLAHGEDRPSGDKGRIDGLNRGLLALEQEWRSTNNPSYFSKAVSLRGHVQQSQLMAGPEYHTFILDLTCGVLLKSRDGTEFDINGESAVRICQNKAVAKLASVDPAVIAGLEAWPDFRARYARLMMVQRARWISLRDPSLDGPIILDSTARLGPRDHAADRLRQKRNQQARLQYDVKGFLSKTGPKIDRFMVRAFSLGPFDFRMLNEMLLIGRYPPEERTKLVTLAAGSTQRLPERLRHQFAGSAGKSSVEPPASGVSGVVEYRFEPAPRKISSKLHNWEVVLSKADAMGNRYDIIQVTRPIEENLTAPPATTNVLIDEKMIVPNEDGNIRFTLHAGDKWPAKNMNAPGNIGHPIIFSGVGTGIGASSWIVLPGANVGQVTPAKRTRLSEGKLTLIQFVVSNADGERFETDVILRRK
jgi:hypothetical protein